MIKAVIIEDNAECVKYLNKILEKFSQIKIVGDTATCVKEGVELINTQKPDIVFLDLELDDGNKDDGFTVLNMAEYRDYHIIVLTAHISEKSYNEVLTYRETMFNNTRAVRYIPKPPDDDMLKDAINYCCNKLPASKQKIVIPKSPKELLIENVCNIDMYIGEPINIPIPVEKEYNTKFHLINGKEVTSIISIDKFKKELSTFFDMGNNRFINKANIKEISIEEKCITMTGGNVFKDNLLPKKIQALYDELRNKEE